MDEQLPEVAIAPLADPQQQRLATRRVLPGYQASPRRELAPILQCGGFPDGGDQRGRGSGADPRQLRQPVTRFMALKHTLNLRIGLPEALIQGLEFRCQRL